MKDSIARFFGNPRLVAAAVLALGGAAAYLISFPGSMEDDSYVQLIEGRTESYSFWHPPVMSWMLGISDALPGPPQAWFVLFDTALAFSALISVLWLVRRVSWAAAAVAGVAVFLPQLLLDQAVVWKDALFADAAVAGFILLAQAGERWENPRWRFAMLAASACFVALAMLARQNGAAVLPFAIAAAGWIAARREQRWWRGAAYAAAVVAVSAGLTLGANALFALRWDGYPATEQQFKVLRLYDITGMVKRDPAVLRIVESEAPRLARVIATDGVRLWSPARNDTLQVPPIVPALDAMPAPVLAHLWREAVILHPGAYLAVRWELFRWVFEPPDVGLCHPFHVGDEGDPDDLKELGMKPRLDRRDLALWDYAAVFVGTPVYSHLAFALIGLGIAWFCLRRRRPADLAIAGMIAGAFAFAATFFAISIACDYRYLYVIDLAAIAGALYVAADWQTKRGPEGPL